MKNDRPKDPPSSGTADFFNFIYDGEQEWALLAVRAPMDLVVDSFAEFRHAKKRLRDVPQKEGSGGNEVAPLVLVVQIKDNPWVVIFRSLFFLRLEDIHSVVEDAVELSKRLKTTALAFVGDDKSDSLGYRCFEKGRTVGCSQTETDQDSAEESSFGSELCLVDADLIEKIFGEKGIYLPACHPVSDGKSSWVATFQSSNNVIERADLIELSADR